MREPEVTVLARATALVGEGPVWNAAAEVIHWVDIPVGAIHTTDPHTGNTRTVWLPTTVGAVAMRSRGGFVAATGSGFCTLDEQGAVERSWDVLPPGIRMNDAKCDPWGRFWAGSTELGFAPGHGALHVLDADGTVSTVLTGLTQPNGLGWSPDGTSLYLVDSRQRLILAFDVDATKARLSGRRIFADLTGYPGLPDGLCVDADGCLWICMWGGGILLRLDAAGRPFGTVRVPVAQPSSCTFVGAGLDTLCVTTAREGLTPAADSADGSLLAVRGLGTGGLPAHSCSI
jgi:sugar lactone lactonase YvrE